MAEMFTVELEGQRELILKLDTMPARLQAALVRTTIELASMLERQVKAGHLSGPTGPHTLSVRTGNLRSSVHQIPIVSTPTMVQGGVAYDTSIPYAAIHEFGGTINIPAIEPVAAQALRFEIGGQAVFARRTKAHTVKMPERAPMREAFREMKDTIINRYEATVRQVLDE